MNLHQLRLFHTVARHGSFSRAAEELGISQPSVSIQVADLERALGVELFEQLGRRVHLTEAGRTLEEYAQRIIALVAEAEAAVGDVAGMRRGRLSLAASITPGTYVLPRAVARFEEAFPQITVSLEIAPARRVQERLLRGELDLGFVGEEVRSPQLVALRMMDDEIVAVVPPDHPAASAGGSVSTAQLREYRLVARERGSGTRETSDAALRAAGVELTPAMELATPEAVKQAVAAGLGVGLLSRLAVADDVAAGRLTALLLRDVPIRRTLYAVRHRGRRLSQAMRAFLQLLGVDVAPEARV